MRIFISRAVTRVLDASIPMELLDVVTRPLEWLVGRLGSHRDCYFGAALDESHGADDDLVVLKQLTFRPEPARQPEANTMDPVGA